MNSNVILFAGGAIGAVAAVATQGPIVAPRLSPHPAAVMSFVILFVGRLLVGDWVTRRTLPQA